MAEIAPDPPGWLTALRFDIDTEGGGAAWIEAELPAPNLVVVNPRNGHAHLVYLLGAWVQTDFSDSRRLKVVRYAAAIERAYTAALGADPAYTGRFHHNPLSDAYVTKIGRDAPYSLDELARYVDLNESALKKNPPIGIGRNVETFDRLRRWAYVAVADWRIGTYESWCGAVADRGGQLAADVGAKSPRGLLKANEVGHIVKSVTRWVWERYGADVPPLLREARIVAQREREKARQRAREAARERSQMSRDEYTAPARQRRSAASEMRRAGLSLRAIATALRCSLGEIHRLLTACVQGSPGPSDFKGLSEPTVATPATENYIDSTGSSTYFEALIDPNSPASTGEHNFTIGAGSSGVWNVLVDGVPKAAISDFQSQINADHEDNGIEADDDQTTFKSGTFSYGLQYQDVTSTWYFWSSATNQDQNTFGWASSFTAPPSNNSPTTVFSHP